jgi:hypothetical protein
MNRVFYKRSAIALALCLGALAFYWFTAAGQILQDRKQAAFLAEHDPGSFLIPAVCLYFHGTEGKDFVRGPERWPRPETCWYTRSGFKTSYPDLWLPVEKFAVQRQVWRTGIDVFRAEQAVASLGKAIEVSVRIAAIGVMSIVCLFLMSILARREGRNRPVVDDWSWRMRDRDLPNRD